MSLIKESFSLAFEISPILLCDGIATDIPGGILPIAVLTESLGLANGLLQGDNLSLENLATRFYPAAGTTLVVQDIDQYPFLNQASAANGVVQKPNRIVMEMKRPAGTQNGGYMSKGLTFAALKAALDNHHKAGGTYTILTPAFIYTGCLMHTMTDTSGFSDQNKQVQHTWSLEFIQPLLYVSQLDSVMNGVMNAFTKGTKVPGDFSWSGLWQGIKGEFIH
ncbi:hypothetical protein [Serratia fonticola]|uniref:hypothetical protein n=1 Tax=Serratia fonticola TaxID=47917 RepID=UPI00301D5BDC